MLFSFHLLLVSAQVNFNYIPSSKTPPSPRAGHLQCKSLSSNFFVVFGGCSSEMFYNDLWLYSLNTATWTEINSALSNPCPRSYLSGFISMITEKLYIFGGDTELGPQNDFWEFDFINYRWILLTTIDTPSIRFGHAYTSFLKDKIEYFAIFGGKQINEPDNSLILLNIKTLKWEKKPNIGDVPPGNMFGTIVYHKGCIYFTGKTPEINNEAIKTFRYDLDKEIWIDVSSPLESLHPRVFASGIVYNNYFYLFFGYDQTDYVGFDSIIRLDLNSFNSLWEIFIVIPEFQKDSFSLSAFSENVYLFGGYSSYELSIDNKLAFLNLKTKNHSMLSDNYISPDGRYSGTMSVINTNFYLFGGKSSKQLFNDMWIFHSDLLYWESANIAGEIPSARYKHSAYAEGDAIVLWGGIDSQGFKNDLYIFNALTNYWSQLIPSSSVIPRPAKGACIVSRIPKIYIYGGVTSSGYSGELWEFDMGNLSYKLISKSIKRAYHTCELIEDNIYVIFGFQSTDDAFGYVDVFNLTSKIWTRILNTIDYFNIVSGSIQVLLGDTVVTIGGRLWQITGFYDVNIFKNSSYLLHIPQFVYSSNYVYYKSSIYSFGGGSSLGNFVISSLANSQFFSIDLNDICIDNLCIPLCSSGTYQTESSCQECSPGYYSEGKGNKKCLPCPIGTYNQNYGASSSRQCYPCPQNSFSSNPGSAKCYDCSYGSSCPAGSTGPFAKSLTQSTYSIQPPIYSTKNFEKITLVYQVIVGFISLGVFVSVLSIAKIKKYIYMIDFYKDYHNYTVNEPMMIKKTFYGGFYSLILISLVVIVIGISIIQYDQNNIIENKSFVSLLVLEAKAVRFSSSLFYISTSFNDYGDACSYKKICSSSIIIEIYNIKGSSITYSCELSPVKSCIIIIKCSDCTISAGAEVRISASERLSYASSIEVNITSDSSIPDSISSLAYSLNPLPNYVFIGSKPSEFYFTISPSLFTSESSKWESELTGYHISSEIPPNSGSQFLNIELPIASEIKVQIYLEINSSGLLTKRILKQTWINLVSGILGSIFGMQGAVGVVMMLNEEYSKYFSKKKLNKNNIISISKKRKMLALNVFDEDTCKNIEMNSSDTRLLKNKYFLG
ncbi:hypothetical protein SteCoe_8895 [Stentor coeruleus]|uniref:Tyrosine-protein kinase ephrin type A/B receptor-like domain-containing protein n=1 Tax=Stentor coeruleus TaxID=5963 RepID=A0A1R2CJ63_9CILI|nr:hypothetical protein SteCoe_8895 [Stentor coeruleus]